jgi:class 3 adenylate cyclase/YHS domain-containing protein
VTEGPQTSTFVVADLSGYTALTEAHGDERAADVAFAFCAEVREALPDYSAEEVKTVGDAIVVRVPDAADAVHLAARILGDFADRDGALAVRLGLHTGTAVRRGDDWFGSAVNVASRIADLANAGEALMSEGTRTAAGDRLADAQARPRGRRELKNVRDPVELFALVPEGHDELGQLPVDPVCRMTVDPRQSAAARVYRGVEYHFCSDGCARAFEDAPQRYTGRRDSSRALALVSDGARERAARRLGRAYVRGRLDREELERRSEAVWQARTRADLRGLTHDLPARRRVPAPWLWPFWPFVVLVRARRLRRRRT